MRDADVAACRRRWRGRRSDRCRRCRVSGRARTSALRRTDRVDPAGWHRWSHVGTCLRSDGVAKLAGRLEDGHIALNTVSVHPVSHGTFDFQMFNVRNVIRLVAWDPDEWHSLLFHHTTH